MIERERCKRLILLASKLVRDEDLESLGLIAEWVKNETPSVKKSLEIVVTGRVTSLMNFIKTAIPNEDIQP